MMKENPEDKLSLAAAQKILEADAANQIKRVAKGGTMANDVRKRLRRRIEKLKLIASTEDLKGKKVTVDKNTFGGRYDQNVRRNKVFDLRIRNYNIKEIMARLRISRTCVDSDLKYIDEAMQRKLDPSDATPILNERLERYESIAREAIEFMMDCEPEERAPFLVIVMRCTELGTELLQDAGVLPRVPKTVRIGGEAGGAPVPVLLSNETNIHVRITRATADSPPVIAKVIEVAREMEQLAANAAG